jgi:hypothetical protein
MDSLNLMRLSLKKGAHAILSNGSVQEIRGILRKTSEIWGTQEFVVRTEFSGCGLTRGSL